MITLCETILETNRNYGRFLRSHCPSVSVSVAASSSKPLRLLMVLSTRNQQLVQKVWSSRARFLPNYKNVTQTLRPVQEDTQRVPLPQAMISGESLTPEVRLQNSVVPEILFDRPCLRTLQQWGQLISLFFAGHLAATFRARSLPIIMVLGLSFFLLFIDISHGRTSQEAATAETRETSDKISHGTSSKFRKRRVGKWWDAWAKDWIRLDWWPAGRGVAGMLRYDGMAEVCQDCQFRSSPIRGTGTKWPNLSENSPCGEIRDGTTETRKTHRKPQRQNMIELVVNSRTIEDRVFLPPIDAE